MLGPSKFDLAKHKTLHDIEENNTQADDKVLFVTNPSLYRPTRDILRLQRTACVTKCFGSLAWRVFHD